MKKTIYVKSFFLVLALCWPSSASFTFAAEEAKPGSTVEETPPRKVGMERELVFKEDAQRDAQRKSVAAAQPHRYTARFELAFRCPNYPDRDLPLETVHTSQGNYLPEMAAIVNQIRPEKPNRYVEPAPDKAEHWLRILWNETDEKLKPPEDIVENLCTSSSVEVGYVTVKAGKVLVIRMKMQDDDKDVLAAKVRAVTLLIDEGLSPRCREGYVAAVKSLERYLGELEDALVKIEQRRADIKQEQEKLSSVKDLPEEALATLIAHKHMLTVKRAGIQARLEACRKILATSSNEQVESVKITAEIDLVGIEAEEKAVEEIIALRMRRTELQAQLDRDWPKISSQRDKVGQVEQLLDQHRQAIAENWAYPEVSEVLITSRPGDPAPERPAGQPAGQQPWWMQ